MAMKLLTKSEQNKAKALEKNKEIQEGLKLAKRVDALREISAQEDKALKEFRKSSLAQITSEILDETKKRDDLQKEVRDLEDRKLEALKPLDLEWDKVKVAKEELTRKEATILGITEGHKAEYEDINRRIKDISDKEAHLATVADITLSKHDRAEKILLQAREQAISSKKIAEYVAREAKELINNAQEKERYIINREKAVFTKEEELREKEIDLAKQVIKIRDRESTLERNIKRNGNRKR